ncbi:hypothetical protein [Microbacterium sp. T2.11-28]|uniref:hypothetical protein n=1 Tax=Microbacterium sp. T2.11-28 TaxID=3041169 RepID=UPI0024778E2B|nr:hypothetical protein [Microbacterium sp. T2.11-28]CAI9392092.1 hypothetical protein MICABA_01996 [Microbacterium sp. T2.11-28]
MSASHNRLTPAPVRQDAPCMCARGGACSSFAPGHAVHLIQARLVSATPAEWVDAIVAAVDPSGAVTLHALEDGDVVDLWSGAGAAEAASPGEPVAYHPRYHALSVGGRLYNVLDLP